MEAEYRLLGPSPIAFCISQASGRLNASILVLGARQEDTKALGKRHERSAVVWCGRECLLQLPTAPSHSAPYGLVNPPDRQTTWGI